jgi:hypothetical protein
MLGLWLEFFLFIFVGIIFIPALLLVVVCFVYFVFFVFVWRCFKSEINCRYKKVGNSGLKPAFTQCVFPHFEHFITQTAQKLR